MTETIEKFDEKINKVENYAAKYGYIKPDDKEKIDLRKSLQEVGKQQPSGFEVCNSQGASKTRPSAGSNRF